MDEFKGKDQLFFDLFCNRSKIFKIKKTDKKAKKLGNQTWLENAGLLFPTKMPAMAKIKTKIMAMMITQHAKFESYQGVMAFRKNGFWSNCIFE